MNKALSEKLRIAACIATLMVVLRHSANWVAFFPNGGAPVWLMKTEWSVLSWTNVAVPFFFFVSGFFFMRVDYVIEKQYVHMLKKKFWALLIPFLVWNMVGGCVLLFHDHEGNLGDSLSSCLTNLLLSHWYGPLWYVRDIMILMLLFPLYGWLYKKWGQSVLILVILWLMLSCWQPGWTNLLATEGIVFFFLGGLAQKHESIMEWKASKGICCVGLCIWIFLSLGVVPMNLTILRLGILIGLFAFWTSLDLIAGTLRDWCLRLAPYSFLIYVMHFYLHKVFKIGLAYVFPQNGVVALIAFFVVPVITVALIVLVGRYWKRLHPKSYAICMGGRG